MLISVLVNGKPKPLESDDIKNIKKELQHIRDTVNHLLDSLEPSAVSEITSSADNIVKGRQS